MMLTTNDFASGQSHRTWLMPSSPICCLRVGNAEVFAMTDDTESNHGHPATVASMRVVLVPQNRNGTHHFMGSNLSENSSGTQGAMLCRAVIDAELLRKKRWTCPVRTQRRSEAFADVSVDALSVVHEPAPAVDDVTIGPAVRAPLRVLETGDISAIFSRRASFFFFAFFLLLFVAFFWGKRRSGRGGEPRKRRVGAEGLEAQNFACFLLPPQMSFFFFSLSLSLSIWGSSLGIVAAVRCREVRVWASLGSFCASTETKRQKQVEKLKGEAWFRLASV